MQRTESHSNSTNYQCYRTTDTITWVNTRLFNRKLKYYHLVMEENPSVLEYHQVIVMIPCQMLIQFQRMVCLVIVQTEDEKNENWFLDMANHLSRANASNRLGSFMILLVNDLYWVSILYIIYSIIYTVYNRIDYWYLVLNIKSYVDNDVVSIKVLYRLVYWTTQLLTWLLIPFLSAYVQGTWSTFIFKIHSFRTNGEFWANAIDIRISYSHNVGSKNRH